MKRRPYPVILVLGASLIVVLLVGIFAGSWALLPALVAGPAVYLARRGRANSKRTAQR